MLEFILESGFRAQEVNITLSAHQRLHSTLDDYSIQPQIIEGQGLVGERPAFSSWDLRLRSSGGGQMIRVLIAEPYKVTRECLRTFLEREQDIQVLDEADSCDKAMSLTRQLNPDVVLLDVDLNRSKGTETVRRIIAQPSKPAVVILAPVEDLAMKDEFLKAGAKAYYCWRDPLTEMLEAIRTVSAGQTYLSRHAASPLPAQTSPLSCS